MQEYQRFWPDSEGWSIDQACTWAEPYTVPHAIDALDSFYRKSLGPNDLRLMRDYLYPIQYRAAGQQWVNLMLAQRSELPAPGERPGLRLWDVAAALDYLNRAVKLARKDAAADAAVGQTRKAQARLQRLLGLQQQYQDQASLVIHRDLGGAYRLQLQLFGAARIPTAGVARLGR